MKKLHARGVKMSSFYRAVPTLLLLSFALHATNAQTFTESDDDCWPPDSDFAAARCECVTVDSGRGIICHSNKKLSHFPTLNETKEKVTIM